MADESPSSGTFRRRLQAAIIGGGKGCESIIRMVRDDALGRFRMEIQGVAELDEGAPGARYAREIGVPLVTTDYRELYEIEDLDLLIELTGDPGVRDELERTRPRGVTLIDHVGARLFWNLHQAEERVLAQRSLLRQEVEAERTRIDQIFRSIPDEVIVIDPDHVIQEANTAFLRNNGFTRDQVVGLHCYEVDSDVRGQCQVAVQGCPAFAALQDGKSSATVRKHFDEEGNARYAAIVSGPVLDPDGAVVGAIEMTRDITHRIQLEEDLKATEVQLQQFMEMAPMATYVKSRQGQYLQVNPATCSLFDRTRGETVGRTDREILPRALADAMVAGDRHVVSRGREMRFNMAVDSERGPIHLSTVKYPILDADGKVSAIGGITEDVTAEKAAVAELDRTREYLQSILDNSQVSIITTDLDGRVVSFNRGAEEMLGYQAGRIIGRPASEFYREPEERVTLLRRVQQEGGLRDHQTTYVREDGTPVQVSVTLSQLRDPHGEMIGTVAVCKDISHRRVLMNQIIQSERLAAVGRLAAGVAHEINNPLAVIGEVTGYLTDVLEEDPDPDELVAELRNWLPKLTDQVRRGRSVTYRMLSFARKSEAEVNVVHVNDAMEEILPFLEKEASLAQVTIHTDYAEGLPRVQVEEMQLQEIYLNLIKNSIQALHGGGGNIWLSTSLRRGKVVTAIRDDGPGISEDVRDRLFDPFVTTKAPGEGTGLGLSICYGIVKRYDGEIRVESTPGEGATFSVIFPAFFGDTQEFEQL